MCCTPLSLSVPSVTSPYFGLAFVVSFCRVGAVLLPFVFVVCVSLRVVPGGICVFLLSLASRARPPFSVLCALLVSCAVFGVSVLPVLPCCVFCLCSSCLPCPADSLLCALVQLTLLCAGASLGVSGCSCDGSVALLSCWVYGPALFSFRHSVHGNKGFLPCVGFFTLYTMLLVTSGSLVRPYRGIHRDDDPDTS